MKRLPVVLHLTAVLTIFGLTASCRSSDYRVAETRYVERNRNTHYLTDDDGKVVFEVPAPILRSVLDQLSAKGDTEKVKAIEGLYDIETGCVHDEEHARSIDQLLRTMQEKRK